VITANGPILTSSAATGNQWYKEGTVIPGATGQTYTATQSGWYWAVVSVNGCMSDTSNHEYILMTGIAQHHATSFTIYPNPNDGQFNVSFEANAATSYTISIFNNLGVKIYEEANIEGNGSFVKAIDLRPVPDGIYNVVLRNDSDQSVKKIIIKK
jgi:hypothetical protein